MKTITFVVVVASITHAAAQSSLDPLSGILSGIESFFTSSTARGGGGASDTQLTDTDFTDPTTGLTGATTDASLTATRFSTIRSSVGGTTPTSSTIRTVRPSVSLVTDGNSLTLASSPTPPVDGGSSGNSSSNSNGGGGVSGSDRVAVIALGTILGALVIGSCFLIFFIIQRRRRPGSSRAGSIFSRRGRSAPAGTASTTRHRDQGSWLGSLRRHQNPQATPVLPLMSEGSPRYGIFSPKFPWTPVSQSRFGVSANSGQNTPHSVNNQPRNRDDVHSGSFYDSNQASANKDRDAPTSNHDVGNPHVQSKPNTPNLSSSKFGQRVLKSAPFLSKLGPSRRSPTTSESVHATSNTEAEQAAPEQTAAEAPEDGFSNAVAGIGFQSMAQGRRASHHVDGSADQSTVQSAGPNDDPAGQAPMSVRPESYLHPQDPVSDRQHRRKSSRVSIPSALMPGRKKSKRARFSLPGDVSPATETAPSVDMERRPSTISPVSPDRSASRGHADIYAIPRRGGSSRARDVETGTLVPKATPFPTSATATTSPAPVSTSAPAVKRKPVPLKLDEALRKPLPVPIPTSKYQPKEVPKIQTPQSTIREVGEKSKDVDAAASGSTSQKLQPQVPNSSQPRRPSPGGMNPRESVGWFRDPANREYAQLYGRYYAQPSPYKFPPSTEGTPRPQQVQFAHNQVPILKSPRPPIRHTQSTPEAFQHYNSPDLTQLPPQIHHQQLIPLGSNPYMPPIQAPARSEPPPKPYTHMAVTHPPNSKEARRNRNSKSTWRDSQVNAWRDSTSREGSEGNASTGTNTDLGVQRSVSEGSSGAGDGPGLWGEPGYFGPGGGNATKPS